MNNIIYTIGFTEKSAEDFFNLLKNSAAERLIDVRLNNLSQLASFSKKNDLKYFLKEILNWEYIHRPDFAPDEVILNEYKKKIIDWNDYNFRYLQLLDNRNIVDTVKKEEIINSVLLCSEHCPDFCHRRLLAEYFQKKWENINIIHLK